MIEDRDLRDKYIGFCNEWDKRLREIDVSGVCPKFHVYILGDTIHWDSQCRKGARLRGRQRGGIPWVEFGTCLVGSATETLKRC